MRRVELAIAVAITCFVATLSPSTADEKPATEKQKIETLIKHVQGLKGAVFIRNDTEYDAETAAKFLRGKWEREEKDVKTAKDFIEKVASVSGTSGKAYRIRLKDGKEKKCGEYLMEQLKKLEKDAREKGKQ